MFPLSIWSYLTKTTSNDWKNNHKIRVKDDLFDQPTTLWFSIFEKILLSTTVWTVRHNKPLSIPKIFVRTTGVTSLLEHNDFSVPLQNVASFSAFFFLPAHVDYLFVPIRPSHYSLFSSESISEKLFSIRSSSRRFFKVFYVYILQPSWLCFSILSKFDDQKSGFFAAHQNLHCKAQ